MKKLKYFLLILPFLFISNVKADLVRWQFAGFNNENANIKSTYYTAQETNRYTPNYFVFDTTGEHFVKVVLCNTGSFNVTSISNTNGVTFYSGKHIGGHCNVQGYTGVIEELYFTIKQTYDAGGGQAGCLFSFNSLNDADYYSFTDFLGVYIADTIPKDITIPNYTAQFNDMSYRIGEVETSQQQIIQKQNEIITEQQNTTNAVNKVDDTLKDDNTQQAQDSAGGFFNDFTTDTHGLTAIITAPLSLISNITSASCSPLVIPLPFVDKDLTLPCMGEIYSNYFGSFLSIYQMITFGIVAYWVLVRIFNLVKDFKNPDHDEIEVLDL